MLQAARMYYVDGLNQQEVGESLHLSRQKVSRLLAEARAKGIVQITLSDPFASDEGLEARFKQTFGLRGVVLTPSEGLNGVALRQRIGVAAAEYLSHALHDGLRVGIGWGQTLYATVTALGKDWRAAIDVVPLVGGIGQMAPSFQVNELARQLAEAFSGSWRPMYIPAFTGDREAHDALMRLEDVQAIVRLWQQVRVAIVGIGPFEFQRRSTMFFGGSLPTRMLPKLEAGGAVGDICARFFDSQGRPVEGEPGVISMNLDELKALDDVIAIAGGGDKVSAILGAIRGGYVKTLVTDTVTAQAVLEQHNRRN
jgi:DNA-binding transcriptional regulator LsrR (DeoR family)